MYSVILDDSNAVSVVPDSWLSENDTVSYWPPYKISSTKFQKSVEQAEAPDAAVWKRYTVRVLYKTGKYFTVII